LAAASGPAGGGNVREATKLKEAEKTVSCF
jgi:hypothetical protein